MYVMTWNSDSYVVILGCELLWNHPVDHMSFCFCSTSEVLYADDFASKGGGEGLFMGGMKFGSLN